MIYICLGSWQGSPCVLGWVKPIGGEHSQNMKFDWAIILSKTPYFINPLTFGLYHTHKTLGRKFLAYLEGILYSWILMWLLPNPQVWTWLYKCSKCGLVIQKKNKRFFVILLNFQCQKLLKTQYLSHLRSKNIQITFIKFYSLSIFSKYQEHT
jgi:hypothetical protein